IKFGFPPELGDSAYLLKRLARLVTQAEEEIAQARQREGRRILGRARVLRQSWRESPTSKEPRRGLRPRVAARCKWARISALQRDRKFVKAHQVARERWL